MRCGAPLLVLVSLTAAPLGLAATQEPLVDLVVEIASDPPRPLAGEPFHLVATVRNLGSDPLRHTVSVAFFANDTPLGEARLRLSPAAPLLPGSERVVVSPDAYVSAPGWPSAYAIVDEGDAIGETNESNNDAWNKIPISLLIDSFTNPTPGAPHQAVHVVSLATPYDEPWSTLDCAAASSLTLIGTGRNGAHVDVCAEGQRQAANTFSLLAGTYVLAFATTGGSGAALYGVPQGDPNPPPPHE